MRKTTALTLYLCGCLILLAALTGCANITAKATFTYPAPVVAK